MDVVEDDDQRRLLFERSAERPGDLLRRCPVLGLAQQRTERRGSRGVGWQCVQLLQHLDHRPIGDPLAVRHAPASDDARLDGGGEFDRQPRLSGAGVAEDGHQLTPRQVEHTLPRLPQRLELSTAADEAAVVPALGGARDRVEPEGGHRLRLALERQRLEGFDDGDVVHERERLGADQDLARLCRLLETRRDVDGVPGRQASSDPAHDLTRVDPDPRLDAEVRECVSHVQGRPTRAKSVVLVRDRHPEDGHDGVADERSDAPAVSLDDPAHPFEVARKQRPERLRIARVAESSGPGDVAEEDGYGPPLLGTVADRVERRAARAAEPRTLLVVVPALSANSHALRVTRPGAAREPPPAVARYPTRRQRRCAT